MYVIFFRLNNNVNMLINVILVQNYHAGVSKEEANCILYMFFDFGFILFKFSCRYFVTKLKSYKFISFLDNSLKGS